MKTFRIRNSVDPKIIGQKFPQVKDVKGNFNVQSPDYIGNSLFYLNNIDINPVLPELILWNGSKVTDLISSSFIGTSSSLICSDRLKEILDKPALQCIQFFSIKIHHKERIYANYWFLHPTKGNNELIDFNASEIWEEKSFLKIKRREFPNHEAFNKEVKELKYPYTLNIVGYKLKSTLPDFFVLTSIDGGVGFFVSEKIKNEIEKVGCTGIVFTEPNERYP